jgi:hypothetical protein
MGIIRSNVPEKLMSVDEQKVDDLDQLLTQIDNEVVAYLNDPQNNPPPHFEQLISQIQSLPERKDQSKSLSLKISNLKHKAYYFDRSWRQIRENVKQAAKGKKYYKRRKETYFCAPTAETKTKMEKIGVNVVEMLYEIQSKKCVEHQDVMANTSPEDKQAFKSRILSQYQTLQKQGDSSKKLVLAWNKDKKRCDLIVDRRVSSTE